jgi:hypothetical protein
VRFLRRSLEGGSQQECCGGKEKVVSPSFEDPATKINLVKAHLNRPSLRAKGTIAPHGKGEAGMLPGLPFKMKGVVLPAPDLQMSVGRRQDMK